MVCFIDLNPVAGPQLKVLDNVEIVEIGTINCGAVDNHILELAGDGYHAGAGRSKLEAKKLGFVQLIRPLERHDAVFVMARRAQALAVGNIIVFHNEAVHGIRTFLRLKPVYDRADLGFGGQIAQGEMVHHIEAQF